jgi:flagellar biosynthesis chaperone FliJ
MMCSTFINDNEPMRIFGDIHGSGEDFTRLQGFYREATYNVELLREKLVASEKARVSTGTSGVDHSRTIDALRKEITAQQEEIRRYRSQSPTSGGSNQEYETKIRTLQSRIQDLESQIRTQKLDYDNQIRSYTSKIENIERHLKLTNTPKSEVSNSTNVLSSGYTPVASGTQNFGTASVTTPQKGGSSYGTGYTPTYRSGNNTSVSTQAATSQPKPNTGGVVSDESSYSYSGSSSSVTTHTRRATGTTYGRNYGATTGTTSYGGTGATGTYGTSSSFS